MELKRKIAWTSLWISIIAYLILVIAPYFIWDKAHHLRHFWTYNIGAFYLVMWFELIVPKWLPGVCVKRDDAGFYGFVFTAMFLSSIMTVALPWMVIINPDAELRINIKIVQYALAISTVAYLIVYYRDVQLSFRVVPNDVDLVSNSCLFTSGCDLRAWPLFTKYEFKYLPKKLEIRKENYSIEYSDGVIRLSELLLELDIAYYSCNAPEREEIIKTFWTKFLESARHSSVAILISNNLPEINVEMDSARIKWSGRFKTLKIV